MIWKKLLQGLNVGKVLKTVTGSIDKKVKVKAISLMGGGGAVVLAGVDFITIAVNEDNTAALWGGIACLLVGGVMAVMLGGVVGDVGEGND